LQLSCQKIQMLVESWTRSDRALHRHGKEPAKRLRRLQRGPGLQTLGVAAPCRSFRLSPAEQHPGAAPALPQNPSPESQQIRALPLEKPSRTRAVAAHGRRAALGTLPARLCQPSPGSQSPRDAF